MEFSLEKELEYIPKYNGNRDLPEDKQIVFTYLQPTKKTGDTTNLDFLKNLISVKNLFDKNDKKILKIEEFLSIEEFEELRLEVLMKVYECFNLESYKDIVEEFKEIIPKYGNYNEINIDKENFSKEFILCYEIYGRFLSGYGLPVIGGWMEQPIWVIAVIDFFNDEKRKEEIRRGEPITFKFVFNPFKKVKEEK